MFWFGFSCGLLVLFVIIFIIGFTCEGSSRLTRPSDEKPLLPRETRTIETRTITEVHEIRHQSSSWPPVTESFHRPPPPMRGPRWYAEQVSTQKRIE
jgi:hypothetical protein